MKKTLANKNRFKYVAIYFVTVIYYMSFYDYGLNLWDEGIGANGALRLYNGDTPGKDFLAYAPGRYYLFLLSYHIFGVKLLSIRKAMVLLTALMPLFSYLISKKIMRKEFAVIVFLLTLSAPGVYYNRFFPVFSIINIFFLINFFFARSGKKLIYLGIVILTTLSFKMEIGIISIICLLTVTVLESKITGKIKLPKLTKSRTVFLVFCIIIFASGIILNDNLREYLSYRLYAIFVIHEKWSNTFPKLFSLNAIKTLGFFGSIETTLFYLPIPVYIVSSILAFKQFKKKNNNNYLCIFIISLFGLLTFGLVIWRAGFDNLIRVLPPFFITFCFIISLWYDELKKGDTFCSGLKVPLYASLISYPLMLIYIFNFNHGFYVGSIGAIKENRYFLKHKRADIYTNKYEANLVKEILEYTHNTIEKHDYIFAVPLNPIFYFLTDKRNPAFHEWILPGSLKNDEEEQKEIIENLKIKKPAVIILSNIAIDGKKERSFSNYAEHIYEYIKDNYVLEKNLGIFYVLRKKT